jgi:hypothetical protein
LFLDKNTSKMASDAIFTNVVKTFVMDLVSVQQMCKSDKNRLSLMDLEAQLVSIFQKLMLGIMREFVRYLAGLSLESQGNEAEKQGLKGLEIRMIKVETSVGCINDVPSLYARKIPPTYTNSRHMLQVFWGITGNYSPLFIKKVSMIFACCPSYDVGSQVLREIGLSISCSKFRRVMNKLGDTCFDKEEHLSLSESETLSGKKVVISIDGGRTRTRVEKTNKADSTKKSFDTPWVEPKVFVIDTVDEKGKIDRHELPVYGCRFSDDDMYGLLTRFLGKLKIEKAESIQVIADGAPWIWARTGELLLSLNVTKNKITETLDYYHAAEHLNSIILMLPKRYKNSQRIALREQFFTWLKQGNIQAIISKINELFINKPEKLKTEIKYFEKNENRMQYADYQANKQMIGSGIIESAIRRIINLRFKNAGTFWHKHTVQKLYFFRHIFLSKRLDQLVHNLANIA